VHNATDLPVFKALANMPDRAMVFADAMKWHAMLPGFSAQDSADVVMQGEEGLPADLRERISFQTHNFFEEQPVKGADVYLLRLVLHDWSDKYSIMILKALIPALKPGPKIVTTDRVIPGCGEAPYLVEREARSVPPISTDSKRD
jgi:hypothetical protein